MSKSKAKGTWAESKVRDYLAHWFPDIMRPAMHGNKDEGDLTGVARTAIEVKNVGVYAIPKWLRETAIEKGHAAADYAVLIVKPNGVGDTRIGEWWAIQPLEDWAADHYELLSGHRLDGSA